IDIGLPDADGRDLCQALRARGIQAPVLFLTARDALVDRLAGFDAGGDDYVCKPFAFDEVVARLNALLRRAGTDGAVEAFGLRLGIRRRLLLVVAATVAASVAALVAGFNILLAHNLSRDAANLVRARAADELGQLHAEHGRLSVAEAPDDASGDAQVWIFSHG